MHRREFLRLGILGGATASVAAIAHAQQPFPPVRIGVLLPVPGNDHFLASLRQGA
jgi:hypothetical protein